MHATNLKKYKRIYIFILSTKVDTVVPTKTLSFIAANFYETIVTQCDYCCITFALVSRASHISRNTVLLMLRS